MSSKQGPRSYVDFQPSFEWSRDEAADVLRVSLPGFKREHIKVQVDNYGNLRTTGECPIAGNRWNRFWKDFRLPPNCRVSEIRAKLENETLIVTLPKDATSSKPAASNQLPTPSKPSSAPPKPASVPDKPKPAPVPEEPKPAPAPEVSKPTVPEPKPAVKQEPLARPNGKLGEMLSTKEDKVDDEAKGMTASSIRDKKETEKKEEKTPVEEKRTEKPLIAATNSAGPSKEPAQSSRVLTGLQSARRGLLLNVAVALIVLVGMGFYLSFKLRKAVVDGEHSNTEEL